MMAVTRKTADMIRKPEYRGPSHAEIANAAAMPAKQRNIVMMNPTMSKAARLESTFEVLAAVCSLMISIRTLTYSLIWLIKLSTLSNADMGMILPHKVTVFATSEYDLGQFKYL
jgi:hypothetical protein